LTCVCVCVCEASEVKCSGEVCVLRSISVGITRIVCVCVCVSCTFHWPGLHVLWWVSLWFFALNKQDGTFTAYSDTSAVCACVCVLFDVLL